jgi:hypothetical protein
MDMVKKLSPMGTGGFADGIQVGFNHPNYMSEKSKKEVYPEETYCNSCRLERTIGLAVNSRICGTDCGPNAFRLG